MSQRDTCEFLCKGTTANIIAGVSAFLSNNNFTVEENEAESSLKAEAMHRNFATLLKNPMPENVIMSLRQVGDETVARVKLKPFTWLRVYAIGTALSTVGLTLLAFAVALHWAKIHDPFFATWSIGVFIAAFFLMIYTYFKSFNLLSRGKFAGHLRDAITKYTGNATYLHKDIPWMAERFLPVITLMAGIAAIIWEPESWKMLFLLPLFGIMMALYFGAGSAIRLSIVKYGFVLGLFFEVYATIPAWSAPLLSGLIKQQMGWHIRHNPSLPALLRESLPLSWQPSEIVLPAYSVLILTIMIVLIMVIGVAGVAIGKIWVPAPDAVKEVDKLRAHLRRASDVISNKHRSFGGAFQSSIWVVWMPLNVLGTYLGLSAFEAGFLGQNNVFHSSIISAFREGLNIFIAFVARANPSSLPVEHLSRAALLFFAGPVVVLVGCIATQTAASTWGRIRLYIETKKQINCVPAEIRELVAEISSWARIKTPMVRIDHREHVAASTLMPLCPCFGAIITVTDGSLKRCLPIEMGSILAHEIGHIKQWRSHIYPIMNLISKWTFFGNGWLLGGFDWFAAEYEADAFALAWAQYKEGARKGRDRLIGLLRELQKFEILHAINEVADRQRNRLMVLGGTSWIPAWLARDVSAYLQLNRWRKLRITLAVYYYLLFGDALLSYCHPEIRQRIDRIMQQAGKA